MKIEGSGYVREDGAVVVGQTEAQAAFVEAWREQYPERVAGPSWRCPLCNTVIQSTSGAPHMAALEVYVAYHQTEHGQDWKAYARLAPTDAAEAGEG